MKYLLGFIGIIIVVCLIIFFFLRVLKIQSITCSNQYGNCTSRLQLEIGTVKKENIFQTKNNLEKVLKNDKSVLDYSIEFRLPLTFQVHVIEKKPITAFITKSGSFALIDSNGDVIDEVKETNLPKVISYYNLDTLQIKYIANLMATIYTYYKSNSAKASQDGLEVNNINGKKVMFPLKGDQDVLLGSLALILSRLPRIQEASTISVIDLRYKNPVLR
jgi:cell division septal protein FtsQ